MVQQILIRRGLASLWTAVNPVLGLGERGIETDTNKEKSGDGVTAWNALPYMSGSGGVAVSAGAASISAGTVVFSNSNGVSFGMAGSTITASAAGAGAGNVTFSAGTSSASLSNLVFSNSNGVSFGLNGSTMTGSVVQSAQTQSVIAGIYDGVASISSGTIRFSNSNGVSFGINGQTVTGSVAVQSAQTQSNIAGVYDGTNSISTGTMRFSNANGVSFGINGQTVTASIAVALNSLTMFGVSNTTNSSSGTLAQSAISVGGYGIVSVGISNGTIQISAPDTTSFAPFAVAMTNSGNTAGNSGSATGSAYFFGSNNITLSGSTNASNISISIIGGAAAGATLSHYDWPPMQVAAMTSVSNINSVYSVQYWPVYANVSGSRLDIPVFVTAPNVANNSTAAVAISAIAVIYSKTGSTLSPIIGASHSDTFSWASNTSGYSQFTGNKYLSFPMATSFAPGEYWVGVGLSTTSGISTGTATTALNATFSMLCGSKPSGGGFNGYADFGALSALGVGPILQGYITSVPTATSQTLQSSQIGVAAGQDAQANIVAVFRNY